MKQLDTNFEQKKPELGKVYHFFYLNVHDL